MRNYLLASIAAVATTLVGGASAAPPPAPQFEAQTIDPEVQIGYGVVVGDVDGDKRLDILLADKRQFVWFRNPGKPGERWPRFVMAENLTELDNVCIAARDIDGDGRVEVAVGAQWNPAETSNVERSGAIFYLIRPADPTARWTPVRIEPHDPTTHRMQWIPAGDKKFALAVLPLHGKDNKAGQGTAVRLQVITPPENLSDPKASWQSRFVDTGMHMTHNFDIVTQEESENIVIAGQEGVRQFSLSRANEKTTLLPTLASNTNAGEVRVCRGRLVTISPMHGSQVLHQYWVPAKQPVFSKKGTPRHSINVVLDDTLREGHALGVADLLKIGQPQVVAGWRLPNADKKVGIRLYILPGGNQDTHVIDDNTMACEDLKIADLDGDGWLDIVASGRATHNLIIYWNRTAP